MRETKGLGPSHLRTVAVLVAAALLLLAGHGVLSSLAAEDPPPATQSDADSDGTSEDNAKEPDTPVEDTSTEETSSDVDDSDAKDEDSDAKDEEGEKGVNEEADSEIEVDPAKEETEEKTEPSPIEEEKGEGSTPPKKTKRIIGATATILEKQSGLLFRARVDTGAKSCSLHVEDMVIEDEKEKWVDNIGKVVRFKARNGSDKSHWLESRIAGYVIIKTTDSRVRRYKVPLILRWKGIEKKVLVTLNNRNGMEYPLLLGRNFLRDDFLVDVDIENDD